MIENKQKQLFEDINDVRKMVTDNVELQKKMLNEMEQKMEKKMVIENVELQKKMVKEIIEQEVMVAKENMEKSSMKTVFVVMVVAVSIAWLCGKVL